MATDLGTPAVVESMRASQSWRPVIEFIEDEARADERRNLAAWLLSDEVVATAAAASEDWFGHDGDLKYGLSEMARAQARVELAAVAELLGDER